jgi:hypothetical protein
MSSHPPTRGPHRAIIPSGVPLRARRITKEAQGMLLRGVVLEVYSYDEVRLRNKNILPAALYCDVLVYSSRNGARSAIFRDCLVSQEIAGMHDGSIWRPRKTTQKIAGTLDVNKLRNPAQLDGDHVLLGFLDNDVATPVVLSAVPHPSADIEKALPAAVDQPGHRLRLIASDADVRLWRHHGTFFGVRADGSYVIDASRGHQGRIEANGAEQAYDAVDPETNVVPPPPNALIRLRPGATFRVEVVGDPDNPDGTTKQIEFQLAQDELRVTLDGETNLVLTQSGANAEMRIGSGDVHVPIGEHLKTLYDNLKARLDAFDLAFANHLHGTSFGPTTMPNPGGSISAPDWNSVPTIISSKVSLPDE